MILQWNMFYRKNIKLFSKFFIKDNIKLINDFSKKHKIDISEFKDELDYFKSVNEKYESMYNSIVFTDNVSELSELSEKETVLETLVIFNKLKNIEYNNIIVIKSLDLDFKKPFYQNNIFKDKIKTLKTYYPDLLFCKVIVLELNEYINKIIKSSVSQS